MTAIIYLASNRAMPFRSLTHYPTQNFFKRSGVGNWTGLRINRRSRESHICWVPAMSMNKSFQCYYAETSSFDCLVRHALPMVSGYHQMELSELGWKCRASSLFLHSSTVLSIEFQYEQNYTGMGSTPWFTDVEHKHEYDHEHEHKYKRIQNIGR